MFVAAHVSSFFGLIQSSPAQFRRRFQASALSDRRACCDAFRSVRHPPRSVFLLHVCCILGSECIFLATVDLVFAGPTFLLCIVSSTSLSLSV